MTYRTPNYFKRDGSVLSWGYLNYDTETIEIDDFADLSRVNTPIERFGDVDSNGDPFTNAKMSIVVDNIRKATFKAVGIYTKNGGDEGVVTTLQQAIDFFTAP